MKPTKFYIFPLTVVVVLANVLLIGVSTAQSSDLYPSNSLSDSSKALDRIIDRQVLEEKQVFLVQTKSEGVELIREAKVVTITQNYVISVENSYGKVIRAFQGFGEGADLIAMATMSEDEALQLLAAGGGLIEPLEP
ncbi:MAG: hypothetical protein ACRC1Z_02385 [Waterburya sp.]